jgi:hypothetical protein
MTMGRHLLAPQESSWIVLSRNPVGGSLACREIAESLIDAIGPTTHKGFAVFAVQSKLLTNMGISVGRIAEKQLKFAPFCPLLAAKWQPAFRLAYAGANKGEGKKIHL